MLFSSLIITATCISGCAGIANGLTTEELKNRAEDILTEAAAVYDYGSYNLSYEQSESLMKQELLSYGESNGYLSSIEASYFRNQIQSEDGYYCCQNMDSAFAKEEMLEEIAQLKLNLALFKDIQASADPTAVSFVASSSDASGDSSINTASLRPGMSFGRDDSGSGGGSSTISFPKKECDINNAAFYGSGNLNNHFFFGVLLTPDFCIGFYNMVAEWFNKQAMYAASGIKSPAQMIKEIWKTIVDNGSSADITACASFVGQVTVYMAQLISSILAVIKSGFPIGTIVAIVLGIISSAVVAFFSTAFWLGYEGKGYAIGWEICGPFSWRWVNEGLC